MKNKIKLGCFVTEEKEMPDSRDKARGATNSSASTKEFMERAEKKMASRVGLVDA